VTAAQLALSLRITVLDGGVGDTLSRIGQRVRDLGAKVAGAAPSMEHLGKAGEALTRWGESTALKSALISEGAEKLSGWGDAILEPAMSMEQTLSRVGAATGMSAAALGRLREQAVAFSDTDPNATAEGYVSVFGRLRQVFQNTAGAAQATQVAFKLQATQGIDAASAGQFLSSVYAALGVSSAKSGDELQKTAQLFGVGNIQQFGMSISRLAGVAATTHTKLSELMVVAGESGQLISGGRGAQMFASLLQQLAQASASGKSPIDMSHGLLAGLEQIHASVRGLSGSAELQALKELGLGSQASLLVPLLGHLDELRAKQAQVAQSGGALNGAYVRAVNNASAAQAKLHHQLANLFEAMGTAALPTITHGFELMGKVVKGLTSEAAAHPEMFKMLTLGLAGLGAAAGAAATALSVVGTVSVLSGSGLTVLSKVFKEGSVASRLFSWGLTKAIPAIYSFGAALLANPLTWYIAAAVALGAVVYEVWKHWDWLKAKFVALGTWLASAGANLMHALAEGIESAALAPVHEVEKVARWLGRLVIGHSPPPEGPLRALGSPGLMEALAHGIRPQPVLGAIRAVAGAAMLAMPMIGVPLLAAAAMGGTPAHSSSAPAPVIDYHVTINGSGLDEAATLRVLRKHAHELYDIWRGEGERRARTEF
jgi:hypothetical protein